MKDLIIKSEACKTRYYNKKTHIKTEMQNIYPQVHESLYPKDKNQTIGPIPKTPVLKVQTYSNRYHNPFWHIISYISNPGFQRFKYDTSCGSCSPSSSYLIYYQYQKNNTMEEQIDKYACTFEYIYRDQANYNYNTAKIHHKKDHTSQNIY